MNFYHCETCGAVLATLVDCKKPLTCCETTMTLLQANTTDAAKEKHVPELMLDGSTLTVNVGSAPHPMLPEHHIQLIATVQGDRMQVHRMRPDQVPSTRFQIEVGRPVTVYEYCNLHGLWKAIMINTSAPDPNLHDSASACSAEFPQGCISED